MGVHRRKGIREKRRRMQGRIDIKRLLKEGLGDERKEKRRG